MKNTHHQAPRPIEPGLCFDNHSQGDNMEKYGECTNNPGFMPGSSSGCDNWAKTGECTNNPGFMTGSSSGVGACRLACKACEVCKGSDAEIQACIGRNRESGGYINFDAEELGPLRDLVMKEVEESLQEDS
eukprot:gene6896-30874_t